MSGAFGNKANKLGDPDRACQLADCLRLVRKNRQNKKQKQQQQPEDDRQFRLSSDQFEFARTGLNISNFAILQLLTVNSNM